ncbi:MAG: c-type cytochrome, partial [Hyphomicrobiales bacterium]|nr:c-type cytochrome [Hyphomicrobiales bacterium]
MIRLSKRLCAMSQRLGIRWFRKPAPGLVLNAFLLAVSACKPDAPEMPAGLLTSQEARAAGAELFAANCAICHGASGDGRGLRREGMNPPPANLRLLAWSDEASGSRIYKIIHAGV